MHTMHFFFQAEDGIRDLYVTGVQTCALPISVLLFLLSVAIPDAVKDFLRSVPVGLIAGGVVALRSEERRVGCGGGASGCACRWKRNVRISRSSCLAHLLVFDSTLYRCLRREC